VLSPTLSGLRVSTEALRDLEQELSKPFFRGVPIGSTLGAIYYLELFLGHGHWDVRSVSMDWLRCWYHHFRGPWRGVQKLPQLKGRILVTWISERTESRDLVLPVLKALDADQCVVICATTSMESQLPVGSGYLDWDSTFAFSMSEWRSEYKRHSQFWKTNLQRTLRRNRLPLRIIPHLEDAMIIQTQRVMASEQLLDTLRPAAVLTEYDRNDRASCLVLAAKSRGIPTMTMIHGVINHACGYTPLLADLAFCWGEAHRDQMIDLGTDPERLSIVGCPRLSRTLSVAPQVARAKVGLPPEKPLVLLATNPILPENKKKLARVFCEGLKGRNELSAAVRLHPSEKLDEYAAEAMAFPMVKFLANDTWTIEEALAAADVVVCHDSGVGNDALVKGKPAVVLDVLTAPLGNGKDLVENAGCPRARSARELSEVVNGIISNPILRRRLKSYAERYVHKFCVAFGDDAASNIANEVLRKLSAHSSYCVFPRTGCLL
jgi:hypothetical protein